MTDLRHSGKKLFSCQHPLLEDIDAVSSAVIRDWWIACNVIINLMSSLFIKTIVIIIAQLPDFSKAKAFAAN